MKRIYLDANATTPLDARVKEAMLPWLGCGNASSPHAEGRAARSALDHAREQVAALVGATPREIVFTSGATEANALALIGTVRARHVTRAFCSAVEHPSVLRTLEGLRPEVDLVVGAVGPDGRLADTTPPEDAELVSVMLANNETGAVQPVAAVAARAAGVVHCDAVQACGKMDVDVDTLGVDLLSLSAHKMAGPKGAGALYVRHPARLEPLYAGGAHERGWRPGTENVAAIVGLGAAAQLAEREFRARRERWIHLGALFIDGIRSRLPAARLNAPEDPRRRIPNTFSVTVERCEGEALLLALDLDGVSIATGSACSSGAMEPSHVLLAIGLSRREADQSVRISFHANTTEADVERCVDALARAVKKLRRLNA